MIMHVIPQNQDGDVIFPKMTFPKVKSGPDGMGQDQTGLDGTEQNQARTDRAGQDSRNREIQRPEKTFVR